MSGRGIPFRDEFDSAFDEVLRVRALPAAAAGELLSRRTIRLSVPFRLFCHVWAGGLPRDIIRVARRLLEARDRTALDTVEDLVGTVVAEDLSAVLEAAAVQVGGHAVEPYSAALLAWADELAAAAGDPVELIASAARTPSGWPAMPMEDDAVAADLRALDRIRGETAAFALLAAFTRQIFARVDDGSPTGIAGLDEERADQLAQARLQLGAGPWLAWHQAAVVRDAFGLKTPAFPVARIAAAGR